MVLIMRSKFRSYPEYHTSLDDLSVVSPAGLQTSFDLHKKCLTLLEVNKTYRTTIIGEPQLSRRGLDTQTGGHTMPSNMRIMIQNFLMCSDGSMDLITIAEEIGVYAGDLLPVVSLLLENDLIENSAP